MRPATTCPTRRRPTRRASDLPAPARGAATAYAPGWPASPGLGACRRPLSACTHPAHALARHGPGQPGGAPAPPPPCRGQVAGARLFGGAGQQIWSRPSHRPPSGVPDTSHARPGRAGPGAAPPGDRARYWSPCRIGRGRPAKLIGPAAVRPAPHPAAPEPACAPAPGQAPYRPAAPVRRSRSAELGQMSPRTIAIRRFSTAPRLARRPSCSYSLVTQGRSPRIATAVRSESSRSTYMSPK